MSAGYLIIVNYDMISCYHQDVKLKLVYIWKNVIWKRIRNNVLLFFFSAKRQETRSTKIYILIHAQQFFLLITKLRNKKVAKQHREIV